jgi:hypothetical protein
VGDDLYASRLRWYGYHGCAKLHGRSVPLHEPPQLLGGVGGGLVHHVQFTVHGPNEIRLIGDEDIWMRISSDDFITPQEIRSQLDHSIDTMRRHVVDVDVTGFILQNLSRVRLFHTANHMSNVLIEQLASGVLQKILDMDVVVDLKCERELMGWQVCPIYPCVRAAIGLMFDDDDTIFKCDGTKSSFKEYVSEYVRVLHGL